MAEKKIFWIQFIALAMIVSQSYEIFNGTWTYLNRCGFTINLINYFKDKFFVNIVDLLFLYVLVKIAIGLYQFKELARAAVIVISSFIPIMTLIFLPYEIYNFFAHHEHSYILTYDFESYIGMILFFMLIYTLKRFLFQKYRFPKFLVVFGFAAGFLLFLFDILGKYIFDLLYPKPIVFPGYTGEIIFDWIPRLLMSLIFVGIIYFLSRPQVKCYFISSPSEDNSHPVQTPTMSFTPQI